MYSGRVLSAEKAAWLARQFRIEQRRASRQQRRWANLRTLALMLLICAVVVMASGPYDTQNKAEDQPSLVFGPAIPVGLPGWSTFSAWLGKDGLKASFHAGSSELINAFGTMSYENGQTYDTNLRDFDPDDSYSLADPRGYPASYMLSVVPKTDPYVGINWNADVCKDLIVQWWIMPSGTYVVHVRNRTGAPLFMTSTQGSSWVTVEDSDLKRFEFDSPGEVSLHNSQDYHWSTRCVQVFWMWGNDLRELLGITPGVLKHS